MKLLFWKYTEGTGFEWNVHVTVSSLKIIVLFTEIIQNSDSCGALTESFIIKGFPMDAFFKFKLSKVFAFVQFVKSSFKLKFRY